MQYAEIIAAALGVLILAAIADQITGRRGFFATLLVSGVGAACGAFLALRVFTVATLTDWTWVGWAMAGAVICLVAFFLFRNKR
ncbi:MAG TPA: transglycosylase [Brevundimonas sp.]|uniref:transglycosylase n=1 Tax=Brevundimonas sp. TaxID=1871086 RepID=UPI00260199B7|nr:transglycosylase [Brevundimonas sp.]HRO34408.1 transglycosylase [Brevundimonas sp.]